MYNFQHAQLFTSGYHVARSCCSREDHSKTLKRDFHLNPMELMQQNIENNQTERFLEYPTHLRPTEFLNIFKNANEAENPLKDKDKPS